MRYGVESWWMYFVRCSDNSFHGIGMPFGRDPKSGIKIFTHTKVIKAYLKPRHVDLQLVEPHNHSVNAAKRAIQTFKNYFIGNLGTTDSYFPVQLWDKLAPQVQDSINLLRQSCINPKHFAYEALEGPYDWNRYPMAPPGTKAIIYDDADSRTSWAPHGLDAWLLGPSKDHYRCHLYYVPEAMQTYSHNTALPPPPIFQQDTWQ
jgi:hypothetical protein